jgi:hypothetical protein
MNINSPENLYILYIIGGVAVVLIGILIGIVVHLHMKLKKFLIGSNVKDLNASLDSIHGSIKDLGVFKKELEKYLVIAEARMRRSIQSVETVRFNPFKGTGSGGNQSFATAFINEEGDGVVISSLYSRDHVSVFSKPVKAGKSEFELTEEESAAIAGAAKSVKNPPSSIAKSLNIK